jgi:methanogenic corrinoid protein MtbC1
MSELRQGPVEAAWCAEIAGSQVDPESFREQWPPPKIVTGPTRRVDRLVRTIEAEVIPRLLLSSREQTAPAPLPAEARLRFEEVDKFTALILSQDTDAAVRHVEALSTQGTSVERVYLELLAPTARRLGEFWDADLVDFTEVTIGVGRLQQVLRAFSTAFQREPSNRGSGRHALLIPTPGEQHSFGLVMVSEFFRRAGWDVWSGAVRSTADVVSIVRSEWFAVIGFSLSCEARLDDLASCIRAVRRASHNRSIGILVGGKVFVDHPDFVALIGADGTADDARQAAKRAHDMLALLAIQC